MISGVGSGDLLEYEAELAGEPGVLDPHRLFDAAADWVAHRHGLLGPRLSVVTACSSGLVGLPPSEGAYLLALERSETARARNARPLAALLGAASLSRPALPWSPPGEDGVAAARELALADAGLDAAAIDLELGDDRCGAGALAALLLVGDNARVGRVLVSSAGQGGHYEALVVGRVGGDDDRS